MSNKNYKVEHFPIPRDIVKCLLTITDSLDKKYKLANIRAIVITRHICFTQAAREFLISNREVWYMHKSYMSYVSLLAKSALSTTKRFALKDDPTHIAMVTLSDFIKILTKKKQDEDQ